MTILIILKAPMRNSISSYKWQEIFFTFYWLILPPFYVVNIIGVSMAPRKIMLIVSYKMMSFIFIFDKKKNSLHLEPRKTQSLIGFPLLKLHNY